MPENTLFEQVFKTYINKIKSFELLGLTDEEINEDMENKLDVALGYFINARDIEADFDLREFNRKLERLEINILAEFMVVEWLTPKVLSESNIHDRLSSRDYKDHSPANMLDKLTKLKKETENNVFGWVNKYSFMKKKVVK